MPVAIILANRWHSELKDILIDILARVSRMALHDLNWHFSNWKRESVGVDYFSAWYYLHNLTWLPSPISFGWALLIKLFAVLIIMTLISKNLI